MPQLDLSALSENLEREEGFRAYAYRDTAGKLTIGHGILIDRDGGGITIEESRYLMANRIAAKLAELDDRWPWWRDMPATAQQALAEMAYQIGTAGVARFTRMLSALHAGAYDTASTEALASRWAQQTPERAARVAAMMRGEA